jgi:hypothetical protein
MQLDTTRIAIRERDLLDVLDLSLQVIRAYAVPWLVTSVVGAAPFAVLNWWLLRSVWPHRGPVEWSVYLSLMAILIAWELPLASAALTRYIGQAVFVDRPSARQIVRDVVDSLPQLFVFQALIRGLFFLPAIWLGEVWWLMSFVLWIPFVAYPHLNEVILLERNPLARSRGRITTWQRSQTLHEGSRGSQFGRWLMTLLLSGLMTASLSQLIWFLRGLLTNHWDYDDAFWLYGLPAAMWIVASFFAVARYLSYLDLRIRREGWEVELQIRAEGDRLTRQIG